MFFFASLVGLVPIAVAVHRHRERIKGYDWIHRFVQGMFLLTAGFFLVGLGWTFKALYNYNQRPPVIFASVFTGLVLLCSVFIAL